MRKLMINLLAACGLAAGMAGVGPAQAETVRFWYHFDNPENPMSALVERFQASHPGIKIEAENVPWNSYYDNLYTAIVGGNAPDAAMVKLFAQPRLVEMGALEPIKARIDSWPGKADLLDNLLSLSQGPEGSSTTCPSNTSSSTSTTAPTCSPRPLFNRPRPATNFWPRRRP